MRRGSEMVRTLLSIPTFARAGATGDRRRPPNSQLASCCNSSAFDWTERRRLAPGRGIWMGSAALSISKRLKPGRELTFDCFLVLS